MPDASSAVASVVIRHVLEDRALQRLLASPGPWNWSLRINDHLRAEALKRVFATLGGDVLDFGCGCKPYEPMLRNPQIRSWIGVDLLQRTSTGDGFENRADVQFDGHRLPLRDGAFDVVLATQVLEHVPDLELALSEIARVVKPGGHVVVTVPMTCFLHEEPHDYRRFTPYGMAKSARARGMVLTETIAIGGPLVTLSTLAACQLNTLARVPRVGRLAQRLVSGGLTQLGYTAEVALFKAGYRKAQLTLDYLFQLRKE